MSFRLRLREVNTKPVDARNEGGGCGFFYACEDFGRMFDHLLIIIIMVIFKRLSLKALSTLQDHVGGGGKG